MDNENCKILNDIKEIIKIGREREERRKTI